MRLNGLMRNWEITMARDIDEYGMVTDGRSLRASRRAARLVANITLFEKAAYDKPIAGDDLQ
jgi:hypothetical protein